MKALSTTKVARMIGVGVVSVVNWINQGRIKAGKTPGGHRRVAVDDLIAFLRKHKLPIPAELKHSPPKVLIVDDEPAIRKWIREEIQERHADYAIREAGDGFSAGQQVGVWKPDAVIMDLRMPGMDGLEVCRQIKARDSEHEPAVIVMTAYYSPDAKREAMKCGAKACLKKPLKAETLMKALDAALHHR